MCPKHCRNSKKKFEDLGGNGKVASVYHLKIFFGDFFQLQFPHDI